MYIKNLWHQWAFELTDINQPTVRKEAGGHFSIFQKKIPLLLTALAPGKQLLNYSV